MAERGRGQRTPHARQKTADLGSKKGIGPRGLRFALRAGSNKNRRRKGVGVPLFHTKKGATRLLRACEATRNETNEGTNAAASYAHLVIGVLKHDACVSTTPRVVCLRPGHRSRGLEYCFFVKAGPPPRAVVHDATSPRCRPCEQIYGVLLPLLR